MVAAVNGHAETVQELLNAGADPLAQSKLGNEGITGLHEAALRGHDKCVKVLLPVTNPDVTDNRGRTAIHSASQGGHIEILKKLKKAGCNVTSVDNGGWSALHFAAGGGCVAAVEFLVQEFSLDPTALDNNGRTPGDVAREEEHHEVEQFFQQHYGDKAFNQPPDKDVRKKKSSQGTMDQKFKDIVGKKKTQALTRAVREGDLEGLRKALRLPGGHPREIIIPTIKKEPWCLLTLAARYGHSGLASELVAAGLTVEGLPEASQTPLMVAAINGHAETVQQLLNAGADPMARSKCENGRTGLHDAALRGHRECVKVLLPVTNPDVTDSRGRTAMHNASQGGHIEILKDLVEVGCNVNIVNNGGWSALHFAAAGGCVAAVELLVQELRLNPTALDNNGNAPGDVARENEHDEVEQWLQQHCGDGAFNRPPIKALTTAVKDGDLKGFRDALRLPGGHPSEVEIATVKKDPWCLLTLAARHGRAHLVAELVAAGLSVEGPSESSQTPLIVAATNGHTQTVQELLKAGADPLAQSRDEDGLIALHEAAIKGHDECVRVLLPVTNPDVTDNRGRTPLHSASQGGHVEILKMLKKAGYNKNITNNGGWSALHFAAAGGCVAAVELLVQEFSLDPTALENNGQTPGDVAREEEHNEVEQWLQQHCGVEAFNKPPIKALTTAVRNGDVEGFRNARRLPGGHLHELKVPTIKNEPWCLLTLAARHGRAGMVAELVAAGLSVEGMSESSQTPLLMAAINGHTETVQELLKAGADPLTQSRTQFKSTALHEAAFGGHSECVKVLLPVTGPDVTDNGGRTPLHNASQRGHVGIMEQLKQAKCNVKAKNDGGWSALHFAASGGCVTAVKFLVQEFRLSPKALDKMGYSPAEIARAEGHHAVEDWLLKHCAAAPLQPLVTHVKRHTAKTIEYYDQCLTDMRHDRTAFMQFNVPGLIDSHVQDEEGATLLHAAATLGHMGAIRTLTENCGVYHHVLNHRRQTPADLAAEAGHQKAFKLLRDHNCNKGRNLPDGRLEELYKDLLNVIYKGDDDDVKQATQLLCQGAPLEPVGAVSADALTLAIRCGRSGLVSLLLAAGAPITSTFEGCNLLELAWTCVNSTGPVAAYVTKTFRDMLRLEEGRAPEAVLPGLRILMATLEENCPWRASWPTGQLQQQQLSSLLLEAVKANCPITACFLVKAGASPFLLASGSTVLHEALSEHNQHLRETQTREHMTDILVRDLRASLYLSDEHSRLPADLMTPQHRRRLEKKLYEQEREKLKEAQQKCTSKTEQENIKEILSLQQHLYSGTQLSVKLQNRSMEAAFLAARLNLQQLTWLLVQRAIVAVDAVVEQSTGTTALHQAAAHGRSACVGVLLTLGADHSRCDRYGYSAAHLAAMFGHNSIVTQLTQYSVLSAQPQPPHKNNIRPPIAISPADLQVNFKNYLKLYSRMGVGDRGGTKGHEDRDEAAAILRILRTVEVQKLVKWSQQVSVKFEAEAEIIRSVVRQELEAIVALVDPIYQGRLELVGSSSDNTKLFAPDEFDYNLVLDHLQPDSVHVVKNGPNQRCKGELRVLVEAKEAGLQGNCLMNNLYTTIKEVLNTHMLADNRLSIVPPGLTKTQVGVALALAWQGNKYPLLLVGVDLVPVLKVAWHQEVEKPPLKPADISTMHLSNTEDGFWRCSFASMEAQVLRGLNEQERQIFLAAKTLLAFLRAEPWMPGEIKAFYIWWCDRHYKVPVPKGFCLKNSFLELLEKKRSKYGARWEEGDTLHWVMQVFRQMCEVPDNLCGELSAGNNFAYFGGACESPKRGDNAPHIVSFLESVLKSTEARGFLDHMVSFLKSMFTTNT